MKVLTPRQTRRAFSSALLLAPLVASSFRLRAADNARIEVWTGPSCSCCHDWIKHLEANGFDVTTHDDGNSDAQSRLGMPINLGSCHTGEVGGLRDRRPCSGARDQEGARGTPDVIGLAVPAMPRGSHGMDGPVYGGVRDPYDMLLIRRDGSALAYQSYR